MSLSVTSNWWSTPCAVVSACSSQSQGSATTWRLPSRETRMASRRAVLANHAPARDGSCRSPRCSQNRSQVVWLTSAASDAPRPTERATDQMRSAKRSTRADQASGSPSRRGSNQIADLVHVNQAY